MKLFFVFSIFFCCSLSVVLSQSNELIFADYMSPNGDGHNDFFEIKNIEQFPINKLFIFNRWGEIVHTAEPYKNDWDGIINSTPILGEALPEGMYFYRFEYLLGDFITQRNGKILLKR